MAYLVDADVLIEAKDRYYGFGFCPGFWDWLDGQKQAGNIFSVERVGIEIGNGQDELTTWAAAQGSDFFLKPNAATVAAMATVTATVQTMKVNGQPYTPAAVTEFLAAGDYYLISHALAHSHTVVTNETGHAQGHQPSLKRLKIPNVCAALNVQCASVFKMLLDGGAKFKI